MNSFWGRFANSRHWLVCGGAAAILLCLLLSSTAQASAQGISTGDGPWVWQNPLPQGNSLTAVWGTDANNVWAVGVKGTMLHWNGSAWRVSDTGTTQMLKDVWGADANNVWAVGTRRYNPALEWQRLERTEQRDDSESLRRVGQRTPTTSGLWVKRSCGGMAAPGIAKVAPQL